MIKVSVIIPVYNAAQFLEKAVLSALQFEEVKEIILVEDASSDNSFEVCQRLEQENKRVILFQHDDRGNHGAAESRNLGIRNATSDFISFLDSDDYYLPNRFEAEKTIFEDQTVDGVFGGLGTEFLTEKGKAEFQEKFKNTELTTVQYPAEGKDVFKGLLGLSEKNFGSFFHLNTLTVRKSSIIKNNLFLNKDLRVHQDSDFIIKLAYHCKLKTGNINEAIAIRGIHDDNRITKIKLYSDKYNQRQYLLWNSLYKWSLKQNLDKNTKECIYLQYRAFELSQLSPLKKIMSLIPTAILHPQILKTKYRFTFTHLNEA